MKAIITGERKSAIVSSKVPDAIGDWVLVKERASAMCTEYKRWIAGTPGNSIGHEGVGEVVAVSDDGLLKKGDLVVVMPQLSCNRCDLCLSGDFAYCEKNLDYNSLFGTEDGRGTFCQYVVKPHWLLSCLTKEIIRAGISQFILN